MNHEIDYDPSGGSVASAHKCIQFHLILEKEEEESKKEEKDKEENEKEEGEIEEEEEIKKDDST